MKKKDKWQITWGVAIFQGKEKLKKITFKTEKDMAYWLYKNEKMEDLT